MEGLPALPRARLRAADRGGRGVAAAAQPRGAPPAAPAGGRSVRGAGGGRGGRPGAAPAAPAGPPPPAARPRRGRRVLQIRLGRHLLRPLRVAPGLPAPGGAAGHGGFHPRHRHHVRHDAAHHGHAQGPAPPLPQALADLLRGLGLHVRLRQGPRRPARGRGGRADVPGGAGGAEVPDGSAGAGGGPHEGHLRQRHRAAAGRRGHDLQHPVLEPVRAVAAPRGAGGAAPGGGGGAGPRPRALRGHAGPHAPAESRGEGDAAALPRHPQQRPRGPRPRHPRGRVPGAPQDPHHAVPLRCLPRRPLLPGARRLPPGALAAPRPRAPPLRLAALRRGQTQLRGEAPGRAGDPHGPGADPAALRGAAGARGGPGEAHDPHPARPRDQHQPPVPEPPGGGPHGRDPPVPDPDPVTSPRGRI